MTVDIIATHESLPDKIKFAQALAGSNLIPQHYRSNPANVLVAIELGNALGIAPIVAINEINIINGSPALSASLMAALARQAGHKVRVTGDAASATCRITRSDDPDFTYEVTWDEAKAKKAGLWGKGHWAKDESIMLKWRTIAECVRLACSEVLGGVKYTPEEVKEMTTTSGPPTVSQVPDEPPASAEVPTIQQAIAGRNLEPTEPPEPITKAQLTKLHAVISELGMERDEGLAFYESVIGHDVESSKDLTKAEASEVIDALESAREAGADPRTGVVDADLVDDTLIGAS